jgi:hypothetical protein
MREILRRKGKKKERRKIYGVQKGQKLCKEDIFEPIKGCKYPFIASGLLPSGALVAHPMK